MMITMPESAGLSILDPLIHTPIAIVELLSNAHAFSFLFSGYACLAALELVRSSSGIVLYLARVAFIITAFAIIAAFQFGDFLAAPAKAAISLVMANQPSDSHPTALYSTLGFLTAGIAYQAGKANTRPQFAGSYRRTQPTSKRLGIAWEKQGRIIDLPLGERQLVRSMSTNRPIKAPHELKRMQTYQVARAWN